MEDVRLSGVAGEAPRDAVGKAGTALRQAADRLRSSGMLDREELQRLRFVPNEMDSVGEYLERRQFRGVRLDAERLIVARPLVALLAAAAAGYLAGRVVRR